MRKGARESVPDRRKSDLWGPKGAERCQNGAKMEANGSLKCTQNRSFEKKVPKVVWTYYLLYILYIGTLRKPHFLRPRNKQNAGLFCIVPRMPPRSCKMTPTGPKNGESGLSRGSQGCQRVPPMPFKMLQKIIKNQHPSPGLPPRVLLGCLGEPTAPKMPPFLRFL